MSKLGTACCTPAPRALYAGKGKEESFGEVNVYVTRPDSSDATFAVILISDVHGWKVPQFRKIGDMVAAAGLIALIPDFFLGDSFVPNPDGSYFPEVDWWLARHLPIDAVRTLKNLLEVLESKGITSYGMSGYCWGAKLAIEAEKVVQTDALKSLALLHPSFITVEECRACRIPVAIFAAEHDNQISMQKLQIFKEALESRKEVDSFVKCCPGTEHGWTTRYDFADEAAAKAADESCQEMIKWYKKSI